MYYVTGGIFTDMTFSVLEDGEEAVCLGPFPDYETAQKAWRGIAAKNLDICCSRYVIEGPFDAKAADMKAVAEKR